MVEWMGRKLRPKRQKAQDSQRTRGLNSQKAKGLEVQIFRSPEGQIDQRARRLDVLEFKVPSLASLFSVHIYRLMLGCACSHVCHLKFECGHGRLAPR